MGLIGNLSLKIFFRLFNPFAKTEEFRHISHKHDVCGMLGLNVYSLQALESHRVEKRLTLYQTLSQTTVHYKHYYQRLTK